MARTTSTDVTGVAPASGTRRSRALAPENGEALLQVVPAQETPERPAETEEPVLDAVEPVEIAEEPEEDGPVGHRHRLGDPVVVPRFVILPKVQSPKRPLAPKNGRVPIAELAEMSSRPHDLK